MSTSQVGYDKVNCVECKFAQLDVEQKKKALGYSSIVYYLPENLQKYKNLKLIWYADEWFYYLLVWDYLSKHA